MPRPRSAPPLIRLILTQRQALIASTLQELIRDGTHSVADLMSLGKRILGRAHVLPSVPHTLTSLQVEGTFPSGTYLVTVHDPIATPDGDLDLALHGSFLPRPAPGPSRAPAAESPADVPGRVVVAEGRVELNAGRERRSLRVVNRGDRPVQIGSHYHVAEANPELALDRARALGFRLDVPAGTAVRFEPGDARTVDLVRIGGARRVRGGNRVAAAIEGRSAEEVAARLKEMGFAHVPEPEPPLPAEAGTASMSRAAYAGMFGPTTGDRVRLALTDLWIRIERDCTVYGDECAFGGGKTLREGMGQASGRADAECLDTVITNAVVLDWSGIYKADIGIRDGIIVGIGKAGNPDVMDGVHENMVVGSCTDVIAGEGKIVTAGGLDTHIHFICPQQAYESIASGITTMLGGGTGPR